MGLIEDAIPTWHLKWEADWNLIRDAHLSGKLKLYVEKGRKDCDRAEEMFDDEEAEGARKDWPGWWWSRKEWLEWLMEDGPCRRMSGRARQVLGRGCRCNGLAIIADGLARETDGRPPP